MTKLALTPGDLSLCHGQELSRLEAAGLEEGGSLWVE